MTPSPLALEKMKVLFLLLLPLGLAIALNGPDEMATVERCEGTAQQCQRF